MAMSMSKFAGIETAVKNAISDKALELEGWKELLKNKTFEVSKPNITIAKELLKPNLTALKGMKEEIEGMFDPIDFVKGMKDAKKTMKVLDHTDEDMVKDLKGELNDLYAMKKNITHVEKLAKKEVIDSAEAKLDALANLTALAKEEAEDKVMGAKDAAYAKIEALANLTAEAKAEALDKIVDVKNVTEKKVDGIKDLAADKINATLAMKHEIKEGAEDKLAMLLNETMAVKGKFADKLDGVKNETWAVKDKFSGKLEGVKNETSKLSGYKSALVGKLEGAKNHTAKTH